MKKIYEVKWHNLDAYGITEHTTVIVQSSSEIEAEKMAKEEILKALKDKAEEHISKYVFKNIKNISDMNVLYFYISNF